MILLVEWQMVVWRTVSEAPNIRESHKLCGQLGLELGQPLC